MVLVDRKSNEKRPVKLGYARKGTRATLAAMPWAELKSPMVVLEDASAADTVFVARALGEAGIKAHLQVLPGVRGSGSLKRRVLYVEAMECERGTRIVAETLERRHRVAELPRQSHEGLKTRAEGGTWPDPTDWNVP